MTWRQITEWSPYCGYTLIIVSLGGRSKKVIYRTPKDQINCRSCHRVLHSSKHRKDFYTISDAALQIKDVEITKRSEGRHKCLSACVFCSLICELISLLQVHKQQERDRRTKKERKSLKKKDTSIISNTTDISGSNYNFLNQDSTKQAGSNFLNLCIKWTKCLLFHLQAVFVMLC